MPVASKPSTVETALTVLREAGTPMAFEELRAAVEAVAPISTKDPRATLRGAIYNTRLIQSLGDGRYGYVPYLATGSVLRHVITEEDWQTHRLILDKEVQTAVWPACFEIQKRADRGPRTFLLPDGREFSAPYEFFGPHLWGLAFPAWVGQWLESQQAAPGDALIVKVVDCPGGIVRLDFEAHATRDETRIAARNAALVETAYEICQAGQSYGLITEDLALRLVARGAYQDLVPPDPLKMLLSQDPRFQWGEITVGLTGRPEPANQPRWVLEEPAPAPLSKAEIGHLIVQGRFEEALQAMWASGLITEKEGEVTVDLRGLGLEPLEAGFGFEEFAPVRRGRRLSRRERRALAQQVYRFKVAFRYRRSFWRRIEIRADQTLGELDGILREAFGHDSWDHLSEFWLGRVWHSQGLGEIEPGGGGPGSEVVVGEIGLPEGAQLGYVYDFGDDIQHTLTLEAIGPADPQATYPRVVEKSKPRYRYCEACKERGHKTVATEICLDCSEARGREVLLCEDCLEAEHGDHWAEEIIY